MPRGLIVGITGGVASGKSVVAGVLERCGAARISADAIARDVLAPGAAATRAVLERFGLGIASETDPAAVDRRRLGAVVFADEAARRDLNAITHPEIHRRLLEAMDAARGVEAPLVAVEVPLLYENHLQALFDRVVATYCPESQQMQRLLARWAASGAAPVTQDAALRQVRSQMPLADKARWADYVIDTSGSLPATEGRASKLYALWTRHAL